MEYSQVKEREREREECKPAKKKRKGFTKLETEWPLKCLEAFKMSYIVATGKSLF